MLSAITIALGGKAITTGRGSGLKSFIREGQRSVHLNHRKKSLKVLISVQLVRGNGLYKE